MNVQLHVLPVRAEVVPLDPVTPRDPDERFVPSEFAFDQRTINVRADGATLDAGEPLPCSAVVERNAALRELGDP
jgi:hypothetical protein